VLGIQEADIENHKNHILGNNVVVKRKSPPKFKKKYCVSDLVKGKSHLKGFAAKISQNLNRKKSGHIITQMINTDL
jgi:hypothetical protein